MGRKSRQGTGWHMSMYRICTLFFISVIAGSLFLPENYAADKTKPFTVVIDAGHGGVDSGAVASERYEKDITLAISHHIKTILTEWNVHTELSRDTDEFITLKERTRRINTLQPDMCISIHVNSSERNSVHGFESFVYHASQQPNTKIRSADKQESSLLFPFESSDRNSASLQVACSLHTRMERHTNARDRGIKAGDFYLIKRVKAPCVLLEVGFLTNAEEGKKLGTAEYQQTIAKAVAEGIICAVYGSDDPSIHQLAAHKNDRSENVIITD